MPIICIRLQREGIVRGLPIRTKSDLPAAPSVRDRATVGSIRVVPVGELAIDPEGPRVQAAAVAQRTATLVVAYISDKQRAARFRGVSGDDVDHAVHGVGAPQCPSRPADHFDALDVLEHHLLLIPEDP